MTKGQIIAAAEVYCGKIIKTTLTHLEIEYESLNKKLECEKFLNRFSVVILQGSTSDIGNSSRIHRVFLS